MSEELYDIVSIQPANGGFGEWQVSGNHTGDPVELGDIFEPGTEFYELGKGELPDDIKDIRGLIQNQPDHVYAAYNDDGGVYYIGANLL